MELDWQEIWVRLKRGTEQFEDEDLKWSEELKVLEWEPKPEEQSPREVQGPVCREGQADESSLLGTSAPCGLPHPNLPVGRGTWHLIESAESDTSLPSSRDSHPYL